MTPEFPYLRGTFCLAESAVPYFQLSLSAAQALRFLKVARELIFDPKEIVLDELFQRDIDQVRVEKEIAPYLQRAGEIKFFNSIVVVLLPHCNEQLQRSYGQYVPSQNGLDIGGIRLHETSKTSGMLCWDPEKICPIIVDGQHRFYALREVALNPSDQMRAELEETSVPVVLLALHELLGFRANESSLLSTVRKIFIDLNRQAKSVSETRNILLDDRDVAAVAVRALLEQHVRSTDESLEARLASGHLPLALVDWYSDKLKFDHGIHLTSILALYQSVSDFLSIPKLDAYDYEKAYSWGQRFVELDPILDYSATIDSCIANKQPVFLGSKEVRHFESWFRDSWGPAIVHVLTSLAPYRELLDKLSTEGFVDGPLEVWAALDKAGKAAFERAYKNLEGIQDRERRITGFKHGNLAFQVVMQRGTLRAFTEMCQVAMQSDANKSVRAFAFEWVKSFNERIGLLSGNHEFWKGTAIRADGAISATRAAEKSIAGMIIFALLAPFDDWTDANALDVTQIATEYISVISKLQQARGLTPLEKLKIAYGRSWRGTVRKYLQDTEHIYGRGETVAGTRFMAATIVACYRYYCGEEPDQASERSLGNEQPKTDEYDPAIDDLDKWI